MQTELSFYEEENLLEQGLEHNRELGKTIRNLSYTNNQDTFMIQKEIIHKIILGHPEGITDQEISLFTGFSLSSVNGRRNELKDVVAVGICVYDDEFGDSHLRTLWGIDNK